MQYPGRKVDAAAAREQSAGIDCEEARVLLARFVEHALPQADDRQLRRHLADCDDCRALYHDTLGSAARLGRAMREVREESERRQRRSTQRRLAMGATGTRNSRFGLRPMLWLAASIFLLFNLSRVWSDPPPLTVTWETGSVSAAGTDLGADQTAGELARADWCTTGPDARALIAGPDADLVLAADSLLLVELADPVRVRLQRGQVSASGTCTITTQLGVVDVAEGAVQVVQEGARFDVLCLLGTITVATPSGTRSLAAGERAELGAELASEEGEQR